MRMPSKVCFAVLATVFASLIQSVAARESDRHLEAAGGFSLVAPSGWLFRSVPGIKYAIAFAPAGSAFDPNINIVDETFSGSLQEYARTNLETMKSLWKDFEVVGHSGFATDSGIQGAWLIGEHASNGNRLRQTFFFFGNGDRKYVITCTTLAETGMKFDASFKSSLRSFRFES